MLECLMPFLIWIFRCRRLAVNNEHFHPAPRCAKFPEFEPRLLPNIGQVCKIIGMAIVPGVEFLLYKLPFLFVEIGKIGIRIKGSVYSGKFYLVGIGEGKMVYLPAANDKGQGIALYQIQCLLQGMYYNTIVVGYFVVR